jgi:hypothetical protein
MLGKEVAEIVTPLALIAVVAGILLMFIRRWKRGVVASDDLEEVKEATREKKKTTEDLKNTRNRMRDLFQRGRMRNRSGN